MGWEVLHPVDLMYRLDTGERLDISPHVHVGTLQERVQEVWEVARWELQRAAAEQQRAQKRQSLHHEYTLNEWVYKWHPPATVGKLGQKWVGPVQITKMINPWLVEIQYAGKLYTVNINNIKPMYLAPEVL